MSSLRCFGVNNQNLSEARGTVRILPIPYDSTTSYNPGARFAPAAILNASPQLEFFDDELEWDVSKDVRFRVEEDIETDSRGPKYMMKKVYETAKNLLQSDDFVLSLGGEHSVSAPVIQAHKEKYPDLRVVQIDAHADLRNTYQKSKYSHACVMRRVVEMGIPVTQIGIRNCSEEEHDFLKTGPDVKLWKSSAIKSSGQWDQLITHLRGIQEPVYLTIDVDGLDPSVVPATGTPEPGGLLWHETMMLLKEICLGHNVVGADIMELSPMPGLSYADFAVAKLTYKVLSYVFYQKLCLP
ncbi:MAG: agmatinase [SAR324 cluster bacterium]|nr:agmatinase [SAR324 cluster bacterium]